MSLVAVAGGVGAAAVGDKHKVVFGKVEGLFFAVLDIDYLFCDFFVSLCFDNDIFNVHAVFDRHTVSLEIFHKGKNHAFILIIFGETQSAEIGQSVDMVDIAAEIAFHFKCARPALEGKHGLPIEPEVGIPEGVGQHVGNFLVLKLLFGGQKKL